jgi:hypothetical protein
MHAVAPTHPGRRRNQADLKKVHDTVRFNETMFKSHFNLLVFDKPTFGNHKWNF